ncbi:glycosyltransferase family 2 protein [Candidatus Microgenomates bacterium]|nr:MAG: glycosyltransferase family 2 protein [Candidatus Microgenomates bacterium]
MKSIDLSIIIISYNTKALTIRCLESIYKSFTDSHVSFEIVVVDNNSTDGSGAAISKNFPKVRLIKNQENAGFGKANNQGIKAAHGEILLLLNSDTEVIGRGIEQLYRFLITQQAKTIVGGKLFNLDKTPQDSCGPAYTLPMIFVALFLKGDYLHLTRYSPDTVKKVDWVMGACMMMAKRAFDDFGFFDEGIFMYMEEIDLQHRAKLKGYQVIFFPDAYFYHKGAASSEGRAAPIINVFRGLLYFYKKHYSKWQLFILRVLLYCKALLGIVLFGLLGKKYDRNPYKEALTLVTRNI